MLMSSRYLKHLASYEPLVLLASLCGLTGALSVIDALKKGDNLPVIVIALCAALLIGGAIAAGRRISGQKLPGPIESKHFYPFLHLEGNSTTLTEHRIARTQEAQRLLSTVFTHSEKHAVLIGDSGVGKSTLVRFDLPALAKLTILEYSEYPGLARIFVGDLLKHFAANSGQTPLASACNAATNAITKYSGAEGERETLTSVFYRCLDAALVAQPNDLLLVFDQSERLFTQLSEDEASSSPQRHRRAQITGALLEAVRRNSRVSSLFVVRSDHASQALARLSDIAHGGDGSVDQAVVTHILHGLNTTTHAELDTVLASKFASIDANLDFDRLQSMLGLRAPSKSNTFMLQLTGYMIEHFLKDSEIRAMARGELRDHNLPLRKYFSILKSEYCYDRGSKDAAKALDLVAYTIASENIQSAQAITEREILLLSHTTIDEVSSALEFLVRKGVVVATTKDGVEGYRIVHDKIADYLLTAEGLTVRPELKEAIAQFTEAGVKKDDMLEPEPVHHIFDFFTNFQQINFAQISIAIMILFCAARLIWPAEVLDLMRPLNAQIERLIPGAVDEENIGFWLYLPIFITQFCWVTFMYYLDRAYFKLVFKNRRPGLRIISVLSSPLGALLGCAFAFAPSLFIWPIILGGSGLALVYFAHSWTGDLRGVSYENAVELGAKTLVNMLLSVGVSIVLYLLLIQWRTDKHSTNIAVAIWFCSAGFIYFWFVMRGRQGVHGWNALLAVFDRGRIGAPKHPVRISGDDA